MRGRGLVTGFGRYEDFRDKLFSIHVDNINPIMDQKGLWSIFKPFGRVRDVYLSSRNNSRGRLFAFIRFETMEEAVKVVKSTNGKHVYGWPIVSKVATLGWNSRRIAEADQSYRSVLSNKVKRQKVMPFDQSQQGNKNPSLSFSASLNRGNREKWARSSTLSFNNGLDHKAEKNKEGSEESYPLLGPTYAETLKVSGKGVRPGVLKTFREVSPVVKGLTDRKIWSSSVYIGDKNILWSFKSIKDRDEFINSRGYGSISFPLWEYGRMPSLLKQDWHGWNLGEYLCMFSVKSFSEDYVGLLVNRSLLQIRQGIERSCSLERHLC
ncbi:hypothetical protein Ddye_029286 [Dipteronia dyeriana]|uniref:RRM domain-containing protein n=1 Tax=Dipteronia dyeriana TaxID=168575 RepID=A0AAD9TE53_9ROSI|nr:hypothetical protein Ddye_029286 [Dipteronia dyeriana]